MLRRRDRGPFSRYDLAVINRHYLQILVDRSNRIMAAQDDLKAAVANAIAVMEQAAAAVIGAAHGNSAELEAAMADAAGQLTAAASALSADLPQPKVA